MTSRSARSWLCVFFNVRPRGILRVTVPLGPRTVRRLMDRKPCSILRVATWICSTCWAKLNGFVSPQKMGHGFLTFAFGSSQSRIPLESLCRSATNASSPHLAEHVCMRHESHVHVCQVACCGDFVVWRMGSLTLLNTHLPHNSDNSKLLCLTQTAAMQLCCRQGRFAAAVEVGLGCRSRTRVCFCLLLFCLLGLLCVCVAAVFPVFYLWRRECELFRRCRFLLVAAGPLKCGPKERPHRVAANLLHVSFRINPEDHTNKGWFPL